MDIESRLALYIFLWNDAFNHHHYKMMFQHPQGSTWYSKEMVYHHPIWRTFQIHPNPSGLCSSTPTAAGPGAFINGGAWDEKRRISFWLNHLQNKAICFTTKCYYALSALQEHRIVKSTKPLTSSFPPQDWNRASVAICSAWNSSSVFSSVRLGMA